MPFKRSLLESYRWLRNGIRKAKKNYDKPTILKLIYVYYTICKENQFQLSVDQFNELRNLIIPLKSDIDVAMESLGTLKK